MEKSDIIILLVILFGLGIVVILILPPLEDSQTDFKEFYEETQYNLTLQSAFDNGTISGVLFERSRILGETNDCGNSLVALNETLGRYVIAEGC